MKIDLYQLMDEINTTITNRYWEGFKPVAFAIYNEEKVFLFNHPNYMSKFPTFVVLSWDDRFVGDTLILFEDYPTAIVNFDIISDFAELFSLLIHELFHGYQHLQGEKRFPDEILGITYPLTRENIELRNRERISLYRAVLSNQAEEIIQFFSIREKRKELIGEYFHYETLVETIEGPAWYVEWKAYCDKSRQSDSDYLQKYGKMLIDQTESCLNIRRSCYSSGMFICLLLDKLSPGWHKSYFQSNLSLYEFFSRKIQLENNQYIKVEISKETDEMIEFVNDQREQEFGQFIHKPGYHLLIEGSMKVNAFDPMNIVLSGKKVLHRNFIKLIINNEEYLFQYPVITYFHHNWRNIHQLHIILNQEPISMKDCLLIDGVGKIKGEYTKNKDGYFLRVKD
ncbi:peptide ABC transporter permease [Heyndrickxia sp. FSL K6-6286]|uniref:peptide ABC transporter permease n=1 Tax=Heyndrickxia sp. FSL K6-6286 TaxID=2921510 RepID=UPI00315AE43A